jgi:sulfur-carrier protein adenylyltransferase/sulfurtransferase
MSASAGAGSELHTRTLVLDRALPFLLLNDHACLFGSDICALHKLPWVYSAILAFEGQLSVFNFPPGIGPDYRDLLAVPPPPGDVPSCAEGGVLGVLPGTLGCLQAVECIKLLLQRTDDGLCAGRVLVFDALRMKFSEVGLRRSPDRDPITELIDYQGFCGGPQSTAAAAAAAKSPPDVPLVNGSSSNRLPQRTMDEDSESSSSSSSSSVLSVATDTAPSPSSSAPAVAQYRTIAPGECFERLRSGWAPYVLDVRLDTEHDIVALPFTDRVVPHRQVSVRQVPKEGDVLVYCKGGVRGRKACERLVEQGVHPRRLYNLQGGILQWQKDVDPSMPRY